MSSVAKGSAFEEKIYEHFCRLISDGRFFASPDCCQIYRQKGYHSRDRDADIIFDIAIEVYMPGSDVYSLLVLIECKEHESSIPVGDVEHLFSRMQQVSGGNTKGIIVATSAFQSGAVKFARSKGIGVARWFGTDNLKWRLRRTPVRWGFRQSDTESTGDILSALTLEQYPSSLFEFYCWNDYRETNSIAELLSDAIQAHLGSEAAKSLFAECPDDEIIPYRTRESIEDLVSELLAQLDYRSGRAPLESICERQRNMAGLQCEHRQPTQEESRQQMLGYIDFARQNITIFDLGPNETNRQRFTLAHELGHYFLQHGDVLMFERCHIGDVEEADTIARIANQYVRRMEIQANHFAGSLLLPAKSLLHDMSRLATEFGLRDKGHGLIYLDHQACNIADYLRITDRLRLSYGASRTAIKYRLQELGLLTVADSGQRFPDG